MTLKQLKAFLTLVRTLNYAHASQELHISQSALSIAIKSLEEEVGGKLFHRSTRHVDVTHEGKSLIPYAKKLLANWEEMENSIKQRFQLSRGTLSMACLPFMTQQILFKVIKQFSNKYPNVNFNLADVDSEQLPVQIREGMFELAMGFAPQRAEGLHFTPLYDEHYIAVIPKSHVLATQQQVTWKELVQYPFIGLQTQSSIRRLIDEFCQRSQLQLALKAECHQLTAISSLVATGLGVSAIPSRCAQHIDTTHNALIEMSGDNIQVAVGLLYPEHAGLSHMSQCFIHELQQAYLNNAYIV